MSITIMIEKMNEGYRISLVEYYGYGLGYEESEITVTPSLDEIQFTLWKWMKKYLE